MIQTRSLRNSDKYHVFSNALIQQSKIFSISASVSQIYNGTFALSCLCINTESLLLQYKIFCMSFIYIKTVPDTV